MRWVVLNMKDFLFADAVAKALCAEKSCDFAVQNTTAVDELTCYCEISSPFALLMEVTERVPYTLEERLRICDWVKEKSPGCRVVLLVDENSDGRTAEQVRQAKKAGRIDQFVYGSISAGYLVALMDTL